MPSFPARPRRSRILPSMSFTLARSSAMFTRRAGVLSYHGRVASSTSACLTRCFASSADNCIRCTSAENWSSKYSSSLSYPRSGASPSPAVSSPPPPLPPPAGAPAASAAAAASSSSTSSSPCLAATCSPCAAAASFDCAARYGAPPSSFASRWPTAPSSAEMPLALGASGAATPTAPPCSPS